MFNKEIPFSKLDPGNLSRVPDIPPKSRNSFNASKVPVHCDSSPPAAENFIVGLFEDVNLLVVHAKALP